MRSEILPSVMVDIQGATNEADGYHDTSAQAHQMDVDQDMSTDDDWSDYITTDVYQSTQSTTSQEQSTMLTALFILKCILSAFLLTGNCFIIVIAIKYIANARCHSFQVYSRCVSRDYPYFTALCASCRRQVPECICSGNLGDRDSQTFQHFCRYVNCS